MWVDEVSLFDSTSIHTDVQRHRSPSHSVSMSSSLHSHPSSRQAFCMLQMGRITSLSSTFSLYACQE